MPGINESRNVRYLWPWALLKNISDVVIFIPGTIWHFVLFWCILYMKQKTCHITSTKCNIEQQHLYDLGWSELGPPLLDPQSETQNWPSQEKCLVRSVLLLEKGNLIYAENLAQRKKKFSNCLASDGLVPEGGTGRKFERGMFCTIPFAWCGSYLCNQPWHLITMSYSVESFLNSVHWTVCIYSCCWLLLCVLHILPIEIPV